MNIFRENNRKVNYYLVAAVVQLGASLSAGAQSLGTIPAPGAAGTAGSERLTQPGVVLPGSAVAVPPPAASAADASKRVRITSVTVRGNTLVPTQDLLAAAGVAEPLASTETSLADLQKMAGAMTRLYRERGFAVASVVLPSQDISNGQVQLQVFEGALDTITVAPQALGDKVKEAISAAGYQAIPEARRNALRQADIERAIMVAAEVSGEKVEGNLVPGGPVGSTGFELEARPQNKATGLLTVDNSGAASTGKAQVSGQLAVRSLVAVGDLLNVNVFASEKVSRLNSFGVGYDLPVGVDGWRAGARASHTGYDLGGTFAAVDMEGTADALGVYGSYALHRRFNAAVDWRFGLNQVALKDKQRGASTSDRESAIYWTDLRGSYNDTAWGQSAFNQWGAAINFGDLTYNGAAETALDARELRRAGNYQVLTVDYLRDQVIAGPWSAQFALRGQAANKNLDSYHKFRLGGANAVRAFAEGEAAGDQGHLVRAELAYSSQIAFNGGTATSRLAAFYDEGSVDTNYSPLPANASNNKAKRAGYGLQWQWTQRAWREADRISLRVFWAEPTGNTKTSAADNKSGRLGLELGYRF